MLLIRPAVLCLTALSLACLGVSAQTKPAAAPASKTISGKSAVGKLLTFKELESCLNEYDQLKPKADDFNNRRMAMAEERKQIEAEAEALRNDGQVAALQAKVAAFNQRQVGFKERIEQFNKRLNDFNENRPSGATGERERKAIDAERTELLALEAPLKAEAQALTTERETVSNSLKQRADAQAAKASDWNVRSKALDNEVASFEDTRAAWTDRCGNRPYNEDHEKIIRSGK
jgi:predicted  nucleic acid-binding Zn-ribbon protein